MYTYFGVLQFERIAQWLHDDELSPRCIGFAAAFIGIGILFTLSRFRHLPAVWTGRRRLVTFLLLSTFVCIITSPREDEMLQMKMERLLRCGQPEKALHAAAKYNAPTDEILRLRIQALSATGELCNDFFTYPLGHHNAAPETLLPSKDFNTDNLASFHRISIYYLLRRDLKGLYAHLRNADPAILQRAELEALVLLAHIHQTSEAVYCDPNIEANYTDFRALEDKTKLSPDVSRANILGETYGDTYWHYYYYGKY